MAFDGPWSAGSGTTDPGGEDFVTATTSGHADIEVRWDPAGHLRPWQQALCLRVERGYLGQGDVVTVVMGDRTHGSPGAVAQTFCEAPSRIRVFVDPYATGVYEELPPIEVDVVSGPATTLDVILPSDVDRSGTFAGSGRAPLDFTTLDPGDESPFVVTLPNAAGVGRYRVSFRTEDGAVRHVDRRAEQARLAAAELK